MASHIRTAVLVLAGLTLAAAPSYAQRSGRRDGGDRGGRPEAQQRAEPRGRVNPGPGNGGQRVEPRGGVPGGGNAVPRGRDYRGGGTYRSGPTYRYDNRAYNYRYNNRYYPGYRSYPYYSRPYGRTYVLPYGWRPYGYRPGWSLNFYFGRPYGYAYGYPGYGYGYYSIAPGLSYGSLRIVDAPRDAQVFVDGYYAGIVDDYDGVFQHLNLEVGSHHIEIEEEGYPPVAFDVRIVPGETITYRVRS